MEAFQPTDQALDFLFSPPGKALLERLAALQVDRTDELAHTTRLRREFPADVVAAALEQVLLRQRAQRKFERAGQMFFTRPALEQASAEIVSRYRARHLASEAQVADLGCGIGGDTLALAALAPVLAVELDPVRLRMAVANAQVYGVGGRVQAQEADLTRYSLPAGLPFWADPSRRVGEKRVFSLADYQPPLSLFLGWAERAPGAGIKLSPGLDYGELEALLDGREAEVEIISVAGEAREAVLWLGKLHTAGRRATLLPGAHTLTDLAPSGPAPVVPVGRYVYEPDAAVIRAHLVAHLAQQMSAAQIDAQIAYLTSDELVDTPFATPYQVEQVMPFNLKQINRHLRGLDVGELVIKKRGLALDPEQFRRRLKYGPGSRRLVLILTRVRDRPTALFCRMVP